MIIIRWVHHISFQARLGVILGSLVAVASDLCYLAIVVVLMCVMFAAAACIGFGYSQLEVSSYGDAIYLLLKYAVFMEDGGVLKVRAQHREGAGAWGTLPAACWQWPEPNPVSDPTHPAHRYCARSRCASGSCQFHISHKPFA